MTIEDPIDALRSQLLALSASNDKFKADRVATAQMFVSMSELFDTALIRTPGMVDQLWNNRGVSIMLLLISVLQLLAFTPPPSLSLWMRVVACSSIQVSGRLRNRAQPLIESDSENISVA